MAVQFRYANLDEYPRLSKFLNDYWAENHIYVRDEPLFQWTFDRRNHWEHGGFSFAVGEDKGELVGILGGIPFRFNNRGKSSKGVWIANYVIRPDYRRGTLALQLLSQFRKPEFNAVVASGINPATISIYKVLRGEVLPDMPRHFLVLPGAAGRMANLLGIAHADWPAEKIEALIEPFSISRMPEISAPFGRSIPAAWDEVDWPEIAAATTGAARDSDFLNWRYVHHPDFEYRFLGVPDGDRTGLAVWRLETIRRATPEGRADVDRIARLVEFLPASRKNAEGLFAAFLGEICAAGAFGADYYGYHGETGCWFEEMGFQRVARHPEGHAIPSRFQPLDGKGGGIMSAMFLQESASPCNEAPECAWYWTKADSDQDRPN